MGRKPRREGLARDKEGLAGVLFGLRLALRSVSQKDSESQWHQDYSVPVEEIGKQPFSKYHGIRCRQTTLWMRSLVAMTALVAKGGVDLADRSLAWYHVENININFVCKECTTMKRVKYTALPLTTALIAKAPPFLEPSLHPNINNHKTRINNPYLDSTTRVQPHPSLTQTGLSLLPICFHSFPHTLLQHPPTSSVPIPYC